MKPGDRVYKACLSNMKVVLSSAEVEAVHEHSVLLKTSGPAWGFRHVVGFRLAHDTPRAAVIALGDEIDDTIRRLEANLRIERSRLDAVRYELDEGRSVP